MAEREIARVNETAGKLANSVVEMLHTDGVRNAVVWVTEGGYFDWPLAVRTPDNDGFGYDEYPYYSKFKDLARAAVLQARYAKAAGGRSALQQENKLSETERTATSYGVNYSRETLAGFAVDPVTGLTVVSVAKGIDSLAMAKYAEAAIGFVNGSDSYLPRMLEAGKWMHACYEMLQPGLRQLGPETSGIAMIALPYYFKQLETEMDHGPVVVAAQTVGRGIDPAKYDIVSAKVKAVAITGIHSGKINDERIKPDYSNILGAVAARFDSYGGRLLAVGGLDMHDDVKVIESVAGSELGRQLGVTILQELAR